jgi:hypothetical protein
VKINKGLKKMLESFLAKYGYVAILLGKEERCKWIIQPPYLRRVQPKRLAKAIVWLL